MRRFSAGCRSSRKRSHAARVVSNSCPVLRAPRHTLRYPAEKVPVGSRRRAAGVFTAVQVRVYQWPVWLRDWAFAASSVRSNRESSSDRAGWRSMKSATLLSSKGAGASRLGASLGAMFLVLFASALAAAQSGTETAWKATVASGAASVPIARSGDDAPIAGSPRLRCRSRPPSHLPIATTAGAATPPIWIARSPAPWEYSARQFCRNTAATTEPACSNRSHPTRATTSRGIGRTRASSSRAKRAFDSICNAARAKRGARSTQARRPTGC